jgi:hypothetical protein
MMQMHHLPRDSTSCVQQSRLKRRVFLSPPVFRLTLS